MEKISEIPWLELAEKSCNGCKDPEWSKKEIAGLLEGFFGAPTESKLQKTIGEIEFAVRRCILEKPLLRQHDSGPNPLTSASPSADGFAIEMWKNFPKVSSSLLKLYWYLVSLQGSSADVPLDSFRELARQMQEFCRRPPPPPPKPIPVRQPAPVIDPQAKRRKAFELSRKLKELDESNPDFYAFLKQILALYQEYEQYLNAYVLAQLFYTAGKNLKPQSQTVETKSLMHNFCQKMPEFINVSQSRQIATFLWSLASLRYRDENILHILTNATRDKIQTFDPQDLSSVLWAFAVLGYQDDSTITLLLSQIAQEAENFDLRSLCNIFWSATVLGFADNQYLAYLIEPLEDILLTTSHGEIHEFGVTQLYHVHLSTGKFKLAKTYFEDRQKQRNPYMEPAQSHRTSHFERRVKDVVVDLLSSEWMIYGSHEEHGFEIDIVIERKIDGITEKIDIEADGPSHEVSFLVDQFRDKILQNLGWKAVIRIPYRPNDDQKNVDDSALKELVRTKLKEAGVIY